MENRDSPNPPPSGPQDAQLVLPGAKDQFNQVIAGSLIAVVKNGFDLPIAWEASPLINIWNFY